MTHFDGTPLSELFQGALELPGLRNAPPAGVDRAVQRPVELGRITLDGNEPLDTTQIDDQLSLDPLKDVEKPEIATATATFLAQLISKTWVHTGNTLVTYEWQQVLRQSDGFWSNKTGETGIAYNTAEVPYQVERHTGLPWWRVSQGSPYIVTLTARTNTDNSTFYSFDRDLPQVFPVLVDIIGGQPGNAECQQDLKWKMQDMEGNDIGTTSLLGNSEDHFRTLAGKYHYFSDGAGGTGGVHPAIAFWDWKLTTAPRIRLWNAGIEHGTRVCPRTSSNALNDVLLAATIQAIAAGNVQDLSP